MESNQTVKVLGSYKLISQLGNGSFGTVYKAIKIQDEAEDKQQKNYAIKQNITSIKPLLHLQSSILKSLGQNILLSTFSQRAFLIPQVYYYQEKEYFSYMVMDLLDTTLEDFANKQMKNTFSKDCLIRIFYSLLKIIEVLHRLGYIHRDIKPANFMLKLSKQKNENQTSIIDTKYIKYSPTIYPIDLGLCKIYINPITKQHIPCKENKKMVGTAIFCSLNTHQGFEQSRRDDLQSIVYLIVYLVKKLPWESYANNKQVSSKVQQKQQQNRVQSPRKFRVDIKNKLESYDQIYKIKLNTDFENFLNDQQLLPSCLPQIYKYIRMLTFQQQPNYEFIYTLLEKQHLTLTGLKFSQINYECKWETLCLKQNAKKQLNEKQLADKKKKIKINFKIPSNKLKKCLNQGLDQNQNHFS